MLATTIHLSGVISRKIVTGAVINDTGVSTM
jgi:hypothetical protein